MAVIDEAARVMECVAVAKVVASRALTRRLSRSGFTGRPTGVEDRVPIEVSGEEAYALLELAEQFNTKRVVTLPVGRVQARLLIRAVGSKV